LTPDEDLAIGDHPANITFGWIKEPEDLMIELKLPTTNIVEVPFAPNMPVEKGERKEVPSLEKRVLVGAPLVLQLIKKTGGISWLAFRFARRVFPDPETSWRWKMRR
jgi:hypothetical protein